MAPLCHPSCVWGSLQLRCMRADRIDWFHMNLEVVLKFNFSDNSSVPLATSHSSDRLACDFLAFPEHIVHETTWRLACHDAIIVLHREILKAWSVPLESRWVSKSLLKQSQGLNYFRHWTAGTLQLQLPLLVVLVLAGEDYGLALSKSFQKHSASILGILIS